MQGANQMVEMLLKPTMQDQRFEEFHARVRETLRLFHGGTFLNVREVEVLLITKNGVSHLHTERGALPK